MSDVHSLSIGLPMAYVGDQFVPFSQASVPIWDLGFLQGVTITERLRTMRGKVWLLSPHLQRMRAGLATCGLALSQSDREIAEIVEILLAHNDSLLPKSEGVTEFSIGIAVTAGDQTAQGPAAYGLGAKVDPGVPTRTRLVIHAVPLDVRIFEPTYRDGVALFVSNIQEVSGDSIPRSIKSRSRLHYWLAEQDPRHIPFRSLPLLCDAAGQVCETPTCSLMIVEEERVVTPPEEAILPGITLDFFRQRLEESGTRVAHESISVARVAQAEEVLLLTTPAVIMPAVQLDGLPIGHGQPGPLFRSLLESFCREWLAAP